MCGKTYTLWSAALLVLGIVFIYGYGPALRLPFSLIDDEAQLSNAQAFVQNLKTDGLASALRNDFSFRAHVYNPGYSILTVALYKLSGGLPYHGLKLLGLALLTSFAFLMPRIALDRCSRVSQISGGTVGALVLLLAEVPGHTDLQSLRANWFRLHPTDAAMALFVGAHILAVFTIARASGKAWKWAVGALAAILLIVAVMMKPTALCLALPLLIYAALRWLSGCRQDAAVTAVAAIMGFLLSCLLLFLIVKTANTTNPAAYGQSYTFTYDNLKSGVDYFKDAWWRTLGPLAIWLAFSFAFRNLIYWNSRIGLRAMWGKNAASLYLFLCWLGLTTAYVPWPHHLPRYLVSGLVPLSGLLGLEFAQQIDLLSTWKLRIRAAAASVAAGMLAMLALPLTVLSAFFLLLCFWVRRKPTLSGHAGWAVAGIGMVGFIYFLTIGLISAKAMQENYCSREFQQARLTTSVGSAFKGGQTIGFLGDATDEHVGSLSGELSREGINPRIQSIKQIAETYGLSKLLFSKALSPKDLIPNPESWVASEVFGPDHPTIQVPLDFWTWRRSIWRRESIRITEPQSPNWDWILYTKK